MLIFPADITVSIYPVNVEIPSRHGSIYKSRKYWDSQLTLQFLYIPYMFRFPADMTVSIYPVNVEIPSWHDSFYISCKFWYSHADIAVSIYRVKFEIPSWHYSFYISRKCWDSQQTWQQFSHSFQQILFIRGVVLTCSRQRGHYPGTSTIYIYYNKTKRTV